MTSPVTMWKGMEKGDRYMILSSIVLPLSFWWIYVGRHKYGTKGLK